MFIFSLFYSIILGENHSHKFVSRYKKNFSTNKSGLSIKYLLFLISYFVDINNVFRLYKGMSKAYP